MHAEIEAVAHSLQPLLDLYDRDIGAGRGHALPTGLPEDARRATACAAEPDQPRQLGRGITLSCVALKRLSSRTSAPACWAQVPPDPGR